MAIVDDVAEQEAIFGLNSEFLGTADMEKIS